MQVQTLSFCHSTLFPPIHSPSLSLRNYNSLSSASGFCDPLKTVFKSPISTGSHGSLIGIIRCGLVEHGSDEYDEDGIYIRRCVEIARKAIGCTSPNPMVGCVIVKDGKVVGEGFHPKAGQPHAEVFALRDAGELAENATAYVSLEPCNHYGRTPPCTEALINAKVKRVVVGMIDPNPIVASKGVDRLKNAGIEVTVGIEEELCRSLNEPFIHQMLTGKPFVTLRYSLSVNGIIVDRLGEGAAESGGYYSRLLQEYDAVIVSSALIIEKSSIPASQEPGANQPLCIVAASNHRSPIQISDLPAEAAAEVIIFSDKESEVESKLAEKGIETVVQDQISLDAILEYSKRQGFCSVLLDLRGNIDDIKGLLQEGLEQNLLQKLVIEVVPTWVEGDDNNSFVALKSLDEVLDIKKLEPKILGKSILLEGYF